MVHPYLRRREGKEPVDYPKPELEQVLGKTLGVPLFQEQAMQVAIVAAGFTPTEADQLRRAMATFKFTGGVTKFRDKLIAGMIDNGYDPRLRRAHLQAAGRLRLLRLSGEPRRLLRADRLRLELDEVPPSGRVLLRDPQRAADGLLRAGPARAGRARARGRGAAGRRQPLGLGLHPGAGSNDTRCAVRLGLRMMRGLAEKDGRQDRRIARGDRPLPASRTRRRADVPCRALVRLAKADAFRSLGLSRREALWAIKALRDETLPLFAAADRREPTSSAPKFSEPAVELLAPMTEGGEVVEDYRSHGSFPAPHPLAFLRERAARQGIAPCAELDARQNGERVTVAGLVLVRQRPGSAKGVMFITLEDESDIANLIVWPSLFDQHRPHDSRRADAGVPRQGADGKRRHRTLIAEYLIDRSDMLRQIGGWTSFTCRPDAAMKPAMAGAVSIRARPRYAQGARYLRARPAHRYADW